MALKDFDDVTPRTRDKNWKEDLPLAQMPKKDEWYTYRVLGGVFSYAQHWIEFINKNGETKRYPVDCANWDPDEEAASNKEGGCPCCELGLRPSVRYMMNAIDRNAQASGGDDPIITLDLAPTVMSQLVGLKKLNMVKGTPYSVANKKHGCDVYLMKRPSKKRGGVEWQVQKGDRSPLEEEELELELLDFTEYWLEPDTIKIREDLKRHGYYSDDSSDEDDDEEEVPKSKKKKKSRGKKRSAPPAKAVEDDDDDDDDDDEDFEPPRRKAPPKRKTKKKAPPPEDDDDDLDDLDDDDDDEEEAPPPRKRKKAKRKAPPPEDDDDYDDDDEEDAPPRKRKRTAAKKIRRAPPPPEDDDDDFDDDDEDDWDDD